MRSNVDYLTRSGPKARRIIFFEGGGVCLILLQNCKTVFCISGVGGGSRGGRGGRVVLVPELFTKLRETPGKNIHQVSSRIFPGNPMIFLGNPRIFLGNPRIFIGNRRIFLGNLRKILGFS